MAGFTRITVTKAADKDTPINAGQYPSYVINLAQSVSGVTSAELGESMTRAENAANAAKVSQNAAKTSETNAKASADASASNLAAIKDSEAKAKASADAAKVSQTAAKTSETNAKASETEAKNSAAAAATSASSISNEVAQTAANAKAAKASEDAAKASQTAAKTSETNAATSAAAAKASETSVSTNTAEAKTAATAAKASEVAAKTSETNAKTSETRASDKATESSNFSNIAKAAEMNSLKYSNEAQDSASSAKIAANGASASMNAASTSSVEASASASAAKLSETSAGESATAAELSNASATEAANQAKTYKDTTSDLAAAAKSSSDTAAAKALESSNSAKEAKTAETNALEHSRAAKESENAAKSAQLFAKNSETNANSSAGAAKLNADKAKVSEEKAAEYAASMPSIDNTDKRYPKVRTAIPNGTDILEFFKTAKTGFYFSTKDVVNGFGDDTNYIWTNGRDDVATEGVETQYGILTAYTYSGFAYLRALNKGFWNGIRDIIVTASGGTTFEDLIVQKSSANRLRMVVGSTQRENRITFHHGLNSTDGGITASVGFPGGSNSFFIANEALGLKPSIELSDNLYYWSGNNRSPITTERSLGGSSFFPRGVVGWSSTPPAYNAGSGMYKTGQGADDPAIIQFAAQDNSMYAAALQLRFNRSILGSLKYRIAGFNSTDFPMGWLDIVCQVSGKQYYRDDNAFFGAGTQTDAIKFGMPNTGTMIQSKYAENRKGQIYIGEDGSIKTRWVGETGKGGNIAWLDVLDSSNTTRDPNGFIKVASPVVKVFKDKCITNEESEGVEFERLGVGHYLIKGTLGFNSDGAWGVNGGVVVPKDENDQPIMWVKTKILKTGDIELRTFHRQHSNVPEIFQNTRIKSIEDGVVTYYADGDEVDIPDNTWIDLRVQMPEDSIYQLKLKQRTKDNILIDKAMTEALEAEMEESRNAIDKTIKQIEDDGWTVPPVIEEPSI